MTPQGIGGGERASESESRRESLEALANAGVPRGQGESWEDVVTRRRAAGTSRYPRRSSTSTQSGLVDVLLYALAVGICILIMVVAAGWFS